MAIDTREKRQSSYSLLVPSLTPGVEPSSIDQAERQVSVWVYSGIAASGAVLLEISTFRPIIRTRRR